VESIVVALAYDEERAGEVVCPGVRVNPTLEIPVPAQHSAAHQVTLPEEKNSNQSNLII